MSAFKRYRDVGIVIILLAVPFFFLRANMKAPTNLNALDRVILRISAPIEFAASSLARGVSNVWESYVYLVDVKADNERLAYDNARLREQVHHLEQKDVENRELRRLLQLRESIPGDLVSAQVVGKDFTEFFRVTRVVLDRGSRNIRPHMPVVSPDGVVGAVLRVNGDAVDVQLAVDAAFGIDVEDQRTRARGFVRGTGDPVALLVQGRERRLARRGRDRRSARHQRQGQVVPEGPPGRARHEGRQARARPRSGDRGRPDGELLAPRRRPDPRRAPIRGRRPGPEGQEGPAPRSREASDGAFLPPPPLGERCPHRPGPRLAATSPPWCTEGGMRNTAFFIAGVVLLLVQSNFFRLLGSLLRLIGWVVRAKQDLVVPGLVPSLVLPLILFMGVHEYSLVRGAGVAFALGYLTDLVGITPSASTLNLRRHLRARPRGRRPARGADDADAGRARARVHARAQRDDPRPARHLRT